ncbi:hypothetical protein HU200_049845 [Digitaria exilis]|uniref:Uncharacterized protein n=1 Tax=Digitaria exilis TaxID=1010633 RepID=A0A835AT35_9POAL|nr:hypothetical protein HU200_049845 [Digitaria exilis]
MAATAVAARSRALLQAVSSSLLRRSCLPTSRRASCINRLPLVSGGLLSALPLHSAVASARLQSAIASESRSWCLVPQGTLLAYRIILDELAVVLGEFSL